MTRQIALGAVIAFAVTVLALSVWEPKPPLAVAPPPAAPAEVAPGPAPAPRMLLAKPFRPEMMRPQDITRSVRTPVLLPAVDAGAPAP